MTAEPARLRQAVLAARDLDAVVGQLRKELGLAEPYADPAVGYFGLRNAVFALGDTFLEIVSPVREDASAARLLAQRGEICGYMLMIQVAELAPVRERARSEGIREVFEVELEDIAEVHLHPSDIGGAIVSASTPVPQESWRWGGPDWHQRCAPLELLGALVAVRDPDAVSSRWRAVLGEPPGVEFVADPADRGVIEIRLGGAIGRPAVELGAVRLVFDQ